MDEAEHQRLQIEFEELVGFLVSSARGLLEEPTSYGPFRLLDAASRLVGLLEQHGLSTQIERALKKTIEEDKLACIGPVDQRRDFLDSLVLMIVEEGLVD